MREYYVRSLAEPVGKIWGEEQTRNTEEKGSFLVAAPLSSTPLPIYEWIIDHAAEFSHWDKVRFVLMDEMMEGNTAYVPITNPASYEGFANKHLLDPLRAKTQAPIPVVKPDPEHIGDFDTEIDLLILAIGVKGNYANVMPGTPENTGWHIAELTNEFRQSHTQQGSQSYEGADFGKYGMSVGYEQVKKAKKVVVIISGEKKKVLKEELLSYDHFDPTFPLSIIRHPEVKDKVEIYMTEDLKTV